MLFVILKNSDTWLQNLNRVSNITIFHQIFGILVDPGSIFLAKRKEFGSKVQMCLGLKTGFFLPLYFIEGHFDVWKISAFSIGDHPFKTSAFFKGGGVKNLPNLPMDSTKKMPSVGG